MPAAEPPEIIISEIADALSKLNDERFAHVISWLRAGARGDLADYLLLEERAVAHARRDRALIAAAHLLGDDLSTATRAALLARHLARYRASAWRHDRVEPACPHPCATLRGLLWTALNAVDRDLAARTIRRIIAAGHQ